MKEGLSQINFLSLFLKNMTKVIFKTVLIHPDKRITTLIIGNQQGDRTTTLIKGKYVVKMVGRNAEGQVNISVSENAKISKETFD
ncbi:hypothetical protein [Sporolactobacillus pectinivorans]|uniref:hypothetical protein n=1 Tax=Sporolactobacillus pectinivorans TaxID=1591408 RepID=UPI00138FFCF8|nr:hypothetical protein [Sporolactobacillus pectinivorans]